MAFPRRCNPMACWHTRIEPARGCNDGVGAGIVGSQQSDWQNAAYLSVRYQEGSCPQTARAYGKRLIPTCQYHDSS
jgi:hypothetical protein